MAYNQVGYQVDQQSAPYLDNWRRDSAMMDALKITVLAAANAHARLRPLPIYDPANPWGGEKKPIARFVNPRDTQKKYDVAYCQCNTSNVIVFVTGIAPAPPA